MLCKSMTSAPYTWILAVSSIFLASQMLGYYLYQIKYMYEYHTVSIPILQGMYQQSLCVLRSQASSERTLLSQKIGLKVCILSNYLHR